MERDWRPSAPAAALAARARLLADIREYFRRAGVLEVETPLLCAGTVTDPRISPLACADRWLQTSPEYAMKRLLAAGSGPIYQVCKAFRGGESGGLHNPEFTMLEWYRPGFELRDLIAETAALVAGVLDRNSWETLSYRDLFLRHLGVDPLLAETGELAGIAREQLDVSFATADRDTWLDLLLSHLIEPRLRDSGLLFVYDYPASQAALARLHEVDGMAVAERFELYVDGIELANGYCELTDSTEQLRRFSRDNEQLVAVGEPPRPADPHLLAALEHGLPACSGVALGLDRLLMLQQGASRLSEVLSFDWERA
jgi:lysyl-tRNA synthetase class 2